MQNNMQSCATRDVAFIQARMGSTRLPGKILMSVEGKSILFRIVEQLRQTFDQDNIVILTSNNTIDNAVIKFCETNGVNYFVGSELNVYDRFVKASVAYPARGYFRFTADNPFLDLSLLNSVRKQISSRSCEEFLFISTRGSGLPIGMDIEYFSKALLDLQGVLLTDYDLEHVTPWMYEYLNPNFEVVPKGLANYGNAQEVRLTVDTEEDLIRVRNFSSWLNGREPTIERSWEWARERS